MEREPNNIDRIPRISYWTTTKLGAGHKVDGNSKRSYKKAI